MPRRGTRNFELSAQRNAEQNRLCEARGCTRRVEGHRRFCRVHRDRKDKTGSPVGKNLTLLQLKPCLRDVKAFLDEHRDHPGIVAAIQYLEGLLSSAVPPPTIHARSTGQERANDWLAYLHREGVDGREVLKMVASIHFYVEWDPRRHQGDEWFDWQVCRRVLQLRPPPYRGNPNKRPWAPRISVRLINYLAPRLRHSIGPVALRIAQAIVQRYDGPDVNHPVRRRPVDGHDVPFDHTDHHDTN